MRDEEYFQYLLDFVSLTPRYTYDIFAQEMVYDPTYDHLPEASKLVDRPTHICEILHKIPYRYINQMDSNRKEDGRNLRSRFLYETHKDPDSAWCAKEPVSVFEVLVALAQRCEDVMRTPEYGDRTSKWFMYFLTNMKCPTNDSAFDYSDKLTDDYIVERVNIFLDAKYTKTGEGGGLYPIKDLDPERDMRKEELYVQMNLWLGRYFAHDFIF